MNFQLKNYSSHLSFHSTTFTTTAHVTTIVVVTPTKNRSVGPVGKLRDLMASHGLAPEPNHANCAVQKVSLRTASRGANKGPWRRSCHQKKKESKASWFLVSLSPAGYPHHRKKSPSSSAAQRQTFQKAEFSRQLKPQPFFLMPNTNWAINLSYAPASLGPSKLYPIQSGQDTETPSVLSSHPSWKLLIHYVQS